MYSCVEFLGDWCPKMVLSHIPVMGLNPAAQRSSLAEELPDLKGKVLGFVFDAESKYNNEKYYGSFIYI